MSEFEEYKEIKNKIDNSILMDKVRKLERFLSDEKLKIKVDGLITTITTEDENNIECSIRTKSLNGRELDLDDVQIKCDGCQFDFFNYGVEIENHLACC